MRQPAEQSWFRLLPGALHVARIRVVVELHGISSNEQWRAALFFPSAQTRQEGRPGLFKDPERHFIEQYFFLRRKLLVSIDYTCNNIIGYLLTAHERYLVVSGQYVP